jgi:CheY-like chemotaxis protein
VELCLQMVSERAHAKGLELTRLIDESVPVQVVGDAGRLRQVLLNLVGNAVKFTVHGKVVVRVAREGEEGGNVRLRFAVTDTGIGIPSEAQKCLFQPFSQADSSITRRFGGTGLGLAISRQLVELMGGTIGVESEAGKGSTFWFTVKLPLRAATLQIAPGRVEAEGLIGDHKKTGRESHETAPGAPGGDKAGGVPPVARPPEKLRTLRILLAEDNVVNQSVARLRLARMGQTVDIVADGRAALEAAQSRPYDIVLMDCQMPEMDGFEATRKLRAWEQTQRAAGANTAPLYIIAMTASAMSGDREACLAAGMDDYVSKPVHADQLAAAIARAPTRP